MSNENKDIFNGFNFTLDNEVSKQLSSHYFDESDITSIFNEENRQSLDASIMSQQKPININHLKIGSKIRCWEKMCFSNAIISIDPNTFKVDCNCGKHKKKMDIIDYVSLSGYTKNDQEQCNYCKKNYKSIKKEKSKLYEITYKNNICENCKKSHEREISNHNLLDFKVKDYTCNCSKEGYKYINYCFDCQQNLCIKCSLNHKDHNKTKFSSIYRVGKEEIENLKENLKEQKDFLKDFSSIMDNWIKRAIEAINDYKKKIELYIQINEKIIKEYKLSKRFYKAIKNIEYINFDLDSFVIDIISSKKNFKRQNNLICKFLNENSKDYFDSEPEEESKNSIQERAIENHFNGPVKKICQLKKEELLIININNKDNNNEELYIYKTGTYFKDNSLLKIEEDEILGLSELKSGNLLMVQKNKFKILHFSQNCTSISNVQIQDCDDKDYSFKEIIQLKNGFLVSLTTHPNKNNKILFWEKNLLSGKYEIVKRKEKEKEKENVKDAISMIEIDKFYFIVLDNKNNIFIYNSYTFQMKRIGHFQNNNKRFIKMLKIKEDTLLFAYKDLIILFNLYTFQVREKITSTIYDIMKVPNSKIYCLAAYYEKNNNFNGIYLIKCSWFENNFKVQTISNNNLHSDLINCIYPLSNGDIISGSSDTKVKIFTLSKEYK